MKKCPFCAEEIQDEAIICRFCGRDVTPETTAAAEPKPKHKSGLTINAAIVLSLIVGGSCLFLVQSSRGGTTSNSPAPAKQYGVLNCQSCAEIGDNMISLWDNPDAAVPKLAGQLPNKTRVQILDSRSAKGSTFYKVTANGQTGWVRDTFLH